MFTKIIIIAFTAVSWLFCEGTLPAEPLKEETADEYDYNDYFKDRTSLRGASKISDFEDNFISDWFFCQNPAYWLVIPGYYQVMLTPSRIVSDGDVQTIIDLDNTALYNWDDYIPYFAEHNISFVMDHNFSNVVSNENDYAYPVESDDLYWTKFLPAGSECTIFTADDANKGKGFQQYQLVSRYEEFSYASNCFFKDYDTDQDMQEKYKVPDGSLVMVTCDDDCTDEAQHVWVTIWSRM